MKLIKKKRFWFGILLILMSAYYLFSKSQYTFKDEEKIINYALKGHHGFKLKYAEHDKDEKVIRYKVYPKGSVNTQDYIDVYCRMNEYLEKYKKYFLNNNYKISLEFVGFKAGGPNVVFFRNWNPNRIEDKDNIQDKLFCMEVLGDTYYGFVMEDINGDMCLEEISAIILEKSIKVSAPSIFEFFCSLNYLNIQGTLSEDAKSDLKQRLPNCEIIF